MGEWRKVEVDAPEGATADHTAYEWQFGGEIEGVFVPAVTKAGGYIDSLIAAGKASQDSSDTSSSSSTTTSDTPAQPQQPQTDQPTEPQPATTPTGEGGAA